MIELSCVMDKIAAFAREHLPRDRVHGWAHIERVLYYAAKVNAELNGNREIIRAACLLHDTGHNAGKEQHHLRSSALASALLTELGIDPHIIDQITECIECHSRQYSGVLPGSPEAQVLYDADGMDLFGAVGLLRGLLAAGGGEHDFSAILGKLEWRLSQVENFYSACARSFVKEQSGIIREFLGQFKAQLSWFRE